jgi:hypothetical protein
VDLVTTTGVAGRKDAAAIVSACELVLEGLASQQRIARNEDAGYSRVRPERPGPGFNPGSGKGGSSSPFA